MRDIVELIQNMPDYIGANGVTIEEMNRAEQELGVKFAVEYKDYLKRIGLACFDGIELTGLGGSSRLNVVVVTKNELARNSAVQKDLYVVEQTNIDGIVIWQSEAGEIYESYPNGKVKKIFGSLYEYIESIKM